MASGASGVQSLVESEVQNLKKPTFEEFDKLVSQTPTNTLIFGEVLDLSVVTTEDDFVAVEVDFRRECQRYGQVVNVSAPRPIRVQQDADLLKDLKIQADVGCCYVVMQDL